MQRYRLRFLLQEVDLRPGDTVLGRSASCHITIEDPLVSRRHARIRIQGECATFTDLDSRNGSFVNSKLVEGEHILQDGDRFRIGTLELVFCIAPEAADEGGPTRRITGSMCRCAECGSPYPEEAQQCPVCGSARQLDEDTISGVIGSAEGWSLELVVAVLQKACSLDRWEDVERMLRRVRPTVERMIAGGDRIERTQLDYVAEAGTTLAVKRESAEWANWILTIYATLSLVPNAPTAQALEQLAALRSGELAAAASRLISNVEANGGPGRDERAVFTRIEALASSTGGG